MRGIDQTLSPHGGEDRDVKDLVGNRKNWDYWEDLHRDGKVN
jgi:hypothetical protein